MATIYHKKIATVLDSMNVGSYSNCQLQKLICALRVVYWIIKSFRVHFEQKAILVASKLNTNV